MAVIFCTACGARNRRRSLNCVLCGGALEGVERLNTRVWEVETELPGAIDELEPLSVWQKIYARPVLSSSVAASVVAIVISSVWLFSYLTQPPKCVEYESYGCSVIVLERQVDREVLAKVENTSYQDLNYRQAEVVDWLRLLVLAQEDNGSLNLGNLLNFSAGGANRLRACNDLVGCLKTPVNEDIDYDGLSGSFGLNAEGIVQRVWLSSDTSASQFWRLEGRVPVGKLPGETKTSYFEEIHLIPTTSESVDDLAVVVSLFRTELAQSGSQVRVILMSNLSSRMTRIPAARILFGQRDNSLSTDGLKVWVELQIRQGDAIWIGASATTTEHLVAASRNQLVADQLAAVVFDCFHHPILEQTYIQKESPTVETICFNSSKFQETFRSPEQLDRVIVLSSPRESQLISSVQALIPASLSPIFLVRG